MMFLWCRIWKGSAKRLMPRLTYSSPLPQPGLNIYRWWPSSPSRPNSTQPETRSGTLHLSYIKSFSLLMRWYLILFQWKTSQQDGKTSRTTGPRNSISFQVDLVQLRQLLTRPRTFAPWAFLTLSSNQKGGSLVFVNNGRASGRLASLVKFSVSYV